MKSLWCGRFGKDMDSLVQQFHASILFDKRMYSEDITGSVAHVTMPAKPGIMTGA